MNDLPSNSIDSCAEDLPRLAAGIKRLESPPAEMPTEFDGAMRETIRTHFETHVSPQRRWRINNWTIGGGLAAAAAVTFTVILTVHTQKSATNPPLAKGRANQVELHAAPPAPGDVDANGRIDILDAFTLARDLELPHDFRPDQMRIFDLNIDGHVDRQDVDAIAMRAVAISKPAVGGRSS